MLVRLHRHHSSFSGVETSLGLDFGDPATISRLERCLHLPNANRGLEKHDLPQLEITNAKDMDMIELWDDRCVQVIANTGNPVGPSPNPYHPR